MAVRKIKSGLIVLCVFICFVTGCGSSWRGSIVHLEDGKVLIKPEAEGEIKSGDKVVIYRETSVVHPVTGEMLDNIKDEIAEVPVSQVRGRTITTLVEDPWFSMIEIDDQVKPARGSSKMQAGSVQYIGTVAEIGIEQKSVELDISLSSGVSIGDSLTIVKYKYVVADPDGDGILAVAVEPVARLKVTAVDSQDKLHASYELIDGKLGWIEYDDAVVKLTGNMLTERLWFQDPSDGFSVEWLFYRNYLRAIRHINSKLYREAILELNDVIRMDSNYRDAGYLLGLCYANLNRYADASKQFNSLLKQNLEDAGIWTALAYAYLKQEKTQDAARAYEKLVNLLPNNLKLWMDMGDIYIILGNKKKAAEAYKKVLEIDKNNEEAFYELQKIADPG